MRKSKLASNKDGTDTEKETEGEEYIERREKQPLTIAGADSGKEELGEDRGGARSQRVLDRVP